MSYVELHNLWGKQVHELTDTELDRALRLTEENGLRTHLVCGMFFRPFPLADLSLDEMKSHPRFQEHMDRLERFITIAHKFKAPNIRTFGFTRDVGGDNPSPRSPDGGGIDEETLAKIAKGIRIACHGYRTKGWCWHWKMPALFTPIPGATCGVYWTACRCRISKLSGIRPTPSSPAKTRPSAISGERPHFDIHCKDAVVLDEGTGLTAWARIGAGGTDWHAHLTLLQNEPVDTYTVETHWQANGQDKAASTRQTFASLKDQIADLP